MHPVIIFLAGVMALWALLSYLSGDELTSATIVIIALIGVAVRTLFVKDMESRSEKEQKELNIKRQKEADVAKIVEDRRVRAVAIKQIDETIRRAVQTMEAIPKSLRAAENLVSKSAKNFENRSFYPFWDSIADAVERLNEYRRLVQRLSELRKEFSEQVQYYLGLPGSEIKGLTAPFPASKASLPALRSGSVTGNRILELYERAHRDYEFSNIYANWRTNRTLVAGFENLSLGLERISSELQHIDFTLHRGFESINQSIYDAADSITSAINEQTRTVTESVNDLQYSQSVSNAGFAEQIGNNRKEQRESEVEMIDLLDNIQRGRERFGGINDAIKQFGTRPVK